MIYMPLWHQRKGDLTPVEVWQEALSVIQEMKDIERGIRHLEVSTIVEELNERYSSFDNVARSEEMAQHSTMLVLATVMFMLAEADADWKAQSSSAIVPQHITDSQPHRGIQGTVSRREG